MHDGVSLFFGALYLCSCTFLAVSHQLLAASNTDIAIGDTAVGRYEQRKMEDFKLAAPKFTDEQWAIMNAATNQGLGGDP